MNKEQSFTKVINEICFPDVNTGRVEITNAFKNRHRELSLEMILKAFHQMDQNLYSIELDVLQINRIELAITKDLKGFPPVEYFDINWLLCKPFSDQPEETKETLYRLFNIN